jgi:hypothetical protein
MLDAKGMRFPIDIILVCIRWYAAYRLNYRHLEEMITKSAACLTIISRSSAGRSGFSLLEKASRQCPDRGRVDTHDPQKPVPAGGLQWAVFCGAVLCIDRKKSVLFEARASAPAPTTLINWQGDRTATGV